MPKKKIIPSNKLGDIAMRELARNYQANIEPTRQRLFDQGLSPYQVQGVLEYMEARMLELQERHSIKRRGYSL